MFIGQTSLFAQKQFKLAEHNLGSSVACNNAEKERHPLEFGLCFQNDLLVLDCDYDTSDKEIITKVK